jgi:hypothetical protein
MMAARDTGPARLPAIPRGTSGNAYVDKALSAIAERMEVREGARGNENERAVTLRELKALSGNVQDVKNKADALGAALGVLPGAALTAQAAVQAFQDAIRKTRLSQDLMQSLNDPTRFNQLRVEVQQALLRDLMAQAQKIGANIQQNQQIQQDKNLSLAMQITEVTAAVQDAASGVRQVQFAADELGRAQAGIVEQVQASLGHYYQDGTPGRANLEEQLTATADAMQGLTAQYTLKVQAGGALAGFGLSATEKDGVPDSAFIVAANKFAVVSPNYAGGMTNLPDASSIPFGVDANGIYMNNNVYLAGTMRIQGGTRTLAQGMRGSVALAATSAAWSDATASAAVWTYLGNAGLPVNTNHLVIGDAVTMAGATRQWNGAAWTAPGMVITGDMLVDGTVSASKVNTNGLVIRDASGNAILGAGTMLSATWINSLPTTKITGLGALATQSSVSSSQVSGLGTLATQSAAKIGSTVQFPDGSTMNTSDFINRLQRIGSGNIGTFMDGAAITQAYIGNAAVGTLQVGGEAVTSARIFTRLDVTDNTGVTPGTLVTAGPVYLAMPAGSSGVTIMATVLMASTNQSGYATLSVYRCATASFTNPVQIGSLFVELTYFRYAYSMFSFDASPINGTGYYFVGVNGNTDVGRLRVYYAGIVVLGGKR